MIRDLVLCLLTSVLLAMLTACGTGFRPGKAFESGEDRFFDDGVDMLREPSRLGGKWAEGYANDLDARVSIADLVALVEVVSLQTNRDLDGAEEKRISVLVKEELYGQSPSGSLILRSTPEAVGYSLILRYEGQLNGRFVAFVRFFSLEGGALGHHFHLSPASTQVQESVRSRVEERIKEEQALGGR